MSLLVLHFREVFYKLLMFFCVWTNAQNVLLFFFLNKVFSENFQIMFPC